MVGIGFELVMTKLTQLLDLLKIVELAEFEIKNKEYDEAEKTLHYLVKDIKTFQRK